MKVSKVRIDKKNEGIKHGIRLIVTQDDSRIRSGSKLYYNLL